MSFIQDLSYSHILLKGRGQMLSLAKIVSAMTINHVPTLVSQSFEGIFGHLSHIGDLVDLGRLMDYIYQFFK